MKVSDNTEVKFTAAQIRKAANHCSTFKGIAQILCPEVFEEDKPKYKAGDWVAYKGTEHVHRLKSRNADCTFSDRENWLDDTGTNRGVYSDCYRLATPEEIKTHLIKEAEKRGFKVGAKILPVGANDPLVIKDFKDYRYESDDCFGAIMQGWWYSNGTWAEIIPTKKTVTKQEIADKFGCSVDDLEIK